MVQHFASVRHFGQQEKVKNFCEENRSVSNMKRKTLIPQPNGPGCSQNPCIPQHSKEWCAEEVKQQVMQAACTHLCSPFLVHGPPRHNHQVERTPACHRLGPLLWTPCRKHIDTCPLRSEHVVHAAWGAGLEGEVKSVRHQHVEDRGGAYGSRISIRFWDDVIDP